MEIVIGGRGPMYWSFQVGIVQDEDAQIGIFRVGSSPGCELSGCELSGRRVGGVRGDNFPFTTYFIKLSLLGWQMG